LLTVPLTSRKVGGPNRPPSKRQLLQARNDEAARRAGSRAAHQASAEAAAQEGWGSYLSRQVQERGAAVGLMGDSVDRLEGDSASWSQEVGAFVGRQKKSLIMGGEALLTPRCRGSVSGKGRGSRVATCLLTFRM